MVQCQSLTVILDSGLYLNSLFTRHYTSSSCTPRVCLDYLHSKHSYSTFPHQNELSSRITSYHCSRTTQHMCVPSARYANAFLPKHHTALYLQAIPIHEGAQVYNQHFMKHLLLCRECLTVALQLPGLTGLTRSPQKQHVWNQRLQREREKEPEVE